MASKINLSRFYQKSRQILSFLYYPPSDESLGYNHVTPSVLFCYFKKYKSFGIEDMCIIGEACLFHFIRLFVNESL